MKRYIVKCGLNNILCKDNQYHASTFVGACGYEAKIYKSLPHAKKQADIKRTLDGRVIEINELSMEVTPVYIYSQKGKYIIEQKSEYCFVVYSFITVNSKLEKCSMTHVANSLNKSLSYYEAKDLIRQQGEIDQINISRTRF